ncbi:histamine N-methyltransferase-like [Ptychodera flava]|uniref:histamine N-methyltransferase-like n=1 Tax=Ptychodera flava TaxID=63121 RepID=UPI00396A9404
MAKELKLLQKYPTEFSARYDIFRKCEMFFPKDEQLRSFRETFSNLKIEKNSCRVLAVGPYDGAVDIPIIDALDSKQSRTEYIVVEPAAHELKKFESMVASKQEQGDWRKVDFEFHAKTIEAYLQETKTAKDKNDFDIIHTIRCAYCFTDPGSVFVDLYERLEKGGLLFNTISTGHLEKILKKADEVNPGSRRCVGVSNLRKVLQQKLPGIDINTTYRKSSLLVDECFKEESRDENLLLDFLVQTIDFRQNASEEVFNDFMTFMKEECCYEMEGKLLMRMDEEDFLIFKK